MPSYTHLQYLGFTWVRTYILLVAIGCKRPRLKYHIGSCTINLSTVNKRREAHSPLCHNASSLCQTSVQFCVYTIHTAYSISSLSPHVDIFKKYVQFLQLPISKAKKQQFHCQVVLLCLAALRCCM